MSSGTILLIILIVARSAASAASAAADSAADSTGPDIYGGGLGLVLIIELILVLLGRI